MNNRLDYQSVFEKAEKVWCNKELISYSMKTGICRICRGKHQAAMKSVANVSPPSEQREEQTSEVLPMEQADSTIANPQTHVRFLLPPEEPSSEVLCTHLFYKFVLVT